MGNDPHPARTSPAGIERKLAAILSADVQGFSRLMGADEEATLRTLQAHREVTDTLIHQRHGRIVGTAGDSILAEFASVIDAVRCAVEIQQQLKARNADLPVDRRMEFRIGVNLGDVMVDGEQIYGDGVNIAARVQALAEPGGICISGKVFDEVKNKLAVRYEDLGEQQVKNIAEAVRVWRVQLEKSESPKSQVQSPKLRRVGMAHRSWLVVTLAGVLLIVGTILTVRYLPRPPLSPQHSLLGRRSLRCCPYLTSPPSSCCPSST